MLLTETKTKTVIIKSKSAKKSRSLTLSAESNTKAAAAEVLKHWHKNYQDIVEQLYLDEKVNSGR
jgi:hypothetical protein